MADKIFAEGIYYNKPHEKQPDFVLGSITVNDNFQKFYEEHAEAGKVTLKILMSQKSGKPYLEVDTWKPLQKPENIVSKEDAQTLQSLRERENEAGFDPQAPVYGSKEINPNDIPF